MALSCFDLENEDHTDFLQRLTHDDDLRADMESDAKGTLEANGFEPDDEDIPDGPHQLPPKQEISDRLLDSPQSFQQFTPNPFLKGGWES